MVKRRRQLSWDVVSRAIDEGVPIVYQLQGTPPADVFVDRAGDRLGLRLPLKLADQLARSDLAEVSVRGVAIEGRKYLEVATESSELFEIFFTFLLSVVGLVQQDGMSPSPAVVTCLGRWKRLLRPQAVLSENEQVGLWAELWLLELFVTRSGAGAVQGWMGPLGEPHDFRFGSKEIEVKATGSHRRVHTISSAEQLVPSPGHVLYLLSVQLEPAGGGGGKSLSDLVGAMRVLLRDSDELSVFETALTSVGYSDEHEAHYGIPHALRSEPTAISVDDKFPAITRDLLSSAMASSERIEEVSYRVNVEAMGTEHPQPEFFSRLVPKGGLDGS